jgi:hypothetical protein
MEIIIDNHDLDIIVCACLGIYNSFPDINRMHSITAIKYRRRYIFHNI